MPREIFAILYEVAADQHGYLTTAQAREAGISPMALVMMERRRTLERVSRGVYRLAQYPHGPLAEYIEATLWPVGIRGVISHQSALALYAVSEVNPGKIHITLPPDYRVRRAVPRRLTLHAGELGDDEQTLFEGIPVTTMIRTIRDCRPLLGDDVLRQAVVDAERKGLVSRRESEVLRVGGESG